MSFKVDWSKLGDVEVDRYKVRSRSSFNFITAAEYKRRMTDEGFNTQDVDALLHGEASPRVLTKPGVARFGVTGLAQSSSASYMSVEAARSFTPEDIGYCYLRMVKKDQWARIASILGPDPRLVRTISVVGPDFSVDELRKLEFVKVEGVLHHLRYGDGSAYEVLRRSLRYFSGAPGIVRDIIGMSKTEGYVIPMNAKLGGEYTVQEAFQVSDSVIEDAVMTGKAKVPLVYMTGTDVSYGRTKKTIDGVIESQSSVVRSTNVFHESVPEKIYTMDKVPYPSMVVLPADVSVSSGGSVVGGKGEPVALIVPAGQSVSAHKPLSGSDSHQDEGKYNSMDTGLKLRTVKLSDEWKTRELRIPAANARFAATDTDFYVARHYDKWKSQHEVASYDQVDITDPFDFNADTRSVRRTQSYRHGAIGAMCVDEFVGAVKVSGLRSEDTRPVAITLNDVVTLVEPGGTVVVNTAVTDTVGVVRASGCGDVSYHITRVVDTYGYDTAHSSPVVWPSGDLIGFDYDFDVGLLERQLSDTSFDHD